jgi:hypothetical protein
MNRNTLTVVAIAMFFLGSGMLFYRGYTVTKEETVLNIGPLNFEATSKEHLTIPAQLGWVLVAGGVLVLVGGNVFKPT